MSGYEKALRYSPPLDPYLTGLVKLENVRTVHTHCLCAVLIFPPSLFPLHCIVLHYIALHCTTLHCLSQSSDFLSHLSPAHCPAPYPSHSSSHSALPFYLYLYLYFSSGEEVAQSVGGWGGVQGSSWPAHLTTNQTGMSLTSLCFAFFTFPLLLFNDYLVYQLLALFVCN